METFDSSSEVNLIKKKLIKLLNTEVVLVAIFAVLAIVGKILTKVMDNPGNGALPGLSFVLSTPGIIFMIIFFISFFTALIFSIRSFFSAISLKKHIISFNSSLSADSDAILRFKSNFRLLMIVILLFIGIVFVNINW